MNNEEYFLSLIGRIINIKRVSRLSETDNSMWRQKNFIKLNDDENICSRMTLYNIERGKIVKNQFIYMKLINKFEQQLFVNYDYYYKFTSIIINLRSAVENYNEEEIRKLFMVFKRIKSENEIILEDYHNILLEIFSVYLTNRTPAKHDVYLNLSISKELNENLYFILIITYWHINLTEWNDNDLKHTLYERLKTLSNKDAFYFERCGVIASRLNYKLEALQHVNSSLDFYKKKNNNLKILSNLIVSFSILREIDPSLLIKKYDSYILQVNSLDIKDKNKAQFYMEAGLFKKEFGFYNEANSLIKMALEGEPYLAIEYLPFLIQLKFMDASLIFKAIDSSNKEISIGNSKIIEFYKLKHRKSNNKYLQEFLVYEVLPNLKKSSYNSELLIILLRAELLKLIAITKNYKLIYLFDSYTF